MKKIKLLMYTLTIFIFFMFANNIVADISTYRVYSLKSDGTKTPISEITTDYNAAKNIMNNYNNTITDVAIIEKDGVLVNTFYGVVTINGYQLMYSDSGLKNQATYVHGDYGRDAAFIDYDATASTVKIKISGYTGWVNFNAVNIIPISTLATNHVIIKNERTILYSNHTNGSPGKVLQHNAPYIYIEKIQKDSLTWYHIKEGTIDGWVKGSEVEETIIPLYDTFYINFNLENPENPWNLYHYYKYKDLNVDRSRFINLGIAPNFLIKNKYYFSFDGNYFYDDFIKMLSDYKNDVYTNSINANNPYYNYYLYLPNHTLTSHSGNDFNNYIGIKYTGKPGSGGSGLKSQLYNEGNNFLEVQSTYNVNALLTMALAINESAGGTSTIAVAKNNLFGHAAVDGNAFEGAATYNTVKDSIIAHVERYVNKYSTPTDSRYYGSHYGNKGSGMGVKYASDPYWGEKMAENAYRIDIAIVRKTFQNKHENVTFIAGQDYLANTIGIKTSNKEVAIKKNYDKNSETIYLLKNNYSNKLVYNMPLVVTDKVYDNEGTAWYKVYTDIGLDDNYNFVFDTYDFNKSIGYVLANDLYVYNNQPIINATDITIDQGSSYNVLTNITAHDLEDGDITSKITYNTTLNTNVAGNYQINYTVIDSMNYSVSKTVNITVKETSTPLIIVSDKTIRINGIFDPLNGVIATDNIDGDITSRINIVSNNVNTSIIGTYQVTYNVTNSLNVTTTKTITITVTSNSIPIIKTTDIYVKKNSEINFFENVKAIDAEDGIIGVTIIENTTNLKQEGTYQITYSAIDSDANTVTKTINVVVEKDYKELKGEFYFHSLVWNDETNKLDIVGSQAIIGIDNLKTTNISYDLIFKNIETNYEIIIPLNRYLENHPDAPYFDKSKKYEETWFKDSIDLTNIKKGEYTLYIRAKTPEHVAISVVSNLFLKDYTRKIVDGEGRGYYFRNNNYKREFPMELVVSENGLLSKIIPTHPANMFNIFNSISFSGNYLKIIGNSFNMNVDYNSKKEVTRSISFKNIETDKVYSYNIGSIVGEELVLKTNDGFSKAKSWFDTQNNVDISLLPKGRYIIYIKTGVDKYEDFGELQDVFLKANMETTINGKQYKLVTNKNMRYRVELIVS